MTILRFHSEADKSKQLAGSPWLYLGSKLENTGPWQHSLGTENRILLGSRLDAIAYELKRPFVKWIKELYSQSVNEYSDFWELSFATRSPETSELFQLICLTILALRLASEEPKLVIVIEDPWVMLTLENALGLSKRNQQARNARIRHGVSCVTRLLFARPFFLARASMRIVLSRILGLGGKPPSQEVQLVSTPMSGPIFKKPYRDPFFGSLPDVLSKIAFNSGFLFPLHTPSRYLRSIRGIRNARALAAWATFTDALKAFVAKVPRPQKPPLLLSLELRELLTREWLLELSSNRFSLNVWQSLTWKRFSRDCSKYVVHTFENHPWEKSLNRALSRANVTRIGYQHSTVPSLLMNHIPIESAENHPNRILSCSPEGRRMLISAGWPASIVTVGGALRYETLPEISKIETAPKHRSTPVLFVALPGVHELCRQILRALSEARLGKIEILLKFHPSIQEMPEWKQIPGAKLTSLPIAQAAPSIDGVLFASSTVGLEALLMGLRVFRFIPEGFITLNPIPEEISSRVEIVDQSSIGKLPDLLIRPKQGFPLLSSTDILFSPIDPLAWKEALI